MRIGNCLHTPTDLTNDKYKYTTTKTPKATLKQAELEDCEQNTQCTNLEF